MFVPPNRVVTAPVTTPVFSLPGDGVDFSTYLGDFKASDPNTIATVGSIILFLAKTALSSSTDPVSLNCLKLFRRGSPAAIILLCAEPDRAAVTENDNNIRAILANDGAPIGWLTNLINAAKKKTLEDSNVEGFFAMVGHSGTKASAVSRLINQITPFFPDNISEVAFRNVLAEGIWTTYRLTRASAGTIMFKLIDDFRALGITVEGDDVEQAILASRDAPWNTGLSLDIPGKYKAYASIYLETCGTGIENWHQGNKAVDELPSARVKGAKVIFKRYLLVKNNVDAIDAIDTIAGITAAGNNFF